jgi:tetratricopeptide (TPR) repeat protein
MDRRAEDHNRIGGESFRRGDLESAALHFEQALEHAKSVADRLRQVDALNNLGIVHESLGDASKALEYYDAALALATAGGGDGGPFGGRYELGVFSAGLNRARVLLGRGDLLASEAALAEAEAAADEIGSRITRAACSKQRALLLQAQGDLEAALDRAREAARLYEIVPRDPASLAGLADARLVLGRLFRARGDAVAAVAEFHAAAETAREVSDRTLIAVALESIAEVLEEQGRLEDAELRYRMALDVNRRIPNLERARRDVAALRRVGEAQGDPALVAECDVLLAELERDGAGD